MHTGKVMGKQPTGKRVNFNVMDFVRIPDGKYIEHWGRNNVMQAFEQL